MQRHIPVYRPILKHALKTAWEHRELWPIAAVAGLAGTGAVINDILNQAKLAIAIPNSFSEAIASLQLLQIYQNSLIFVSPTQITIGTLILLSVVALLLIGIAACQQVILRVAHRAASKKTAIEFKELKHEFVHPRIFRFLALDLLLKLGVTNLIVGATLLVAHLDISTVLPDALFGIIFSLSIISFAMIMNVIVMLALIGVARRDLGFANSLAYAWRTYRKHSLICFEMSMILFAVNFLLSTVYNGAILVLGVPVAFSFLAAFELSSFPIYIGLLTLTMLIAATITLAFAGFVTTFTYSAWTALAEHLDKKSLTPRVVVHTKRLLKIT